MRKFMGMIGALIVLMILVTGGICTAASVNWTQLYQSTQQATGLEEQLFNATALVNLGQLGAAFDQIDAIMQEEDYLEFAQDMQAKYTALLEKDTTNILYLNILGLVEWGLANYGQASRYFQQLVALEPGNVWVRLFLAVTLWKQDEHQQALEVLKAAHDLDKQNQYTHCLLAAVYFELRNYIRAAYHYLKCPDVRKEMAARGF